VFAQFLRQSVTCMRMSHPAYSIIIITIIWHNNRLWVFALSPKSLHALLSLPVSFQFLTSGFFRSSMTSSCHRCLGLPTGLVPIGLQSNSFLVGLAWSILWICPSHLILCALMYLTISAPCINPLNAELNPICHLLALLGVHHFPHVSRIRVKSLTLRVLMSCIYMEHLFLIFLDHTQRRTTVGRTPLDE